MKKLVLAALAALPLSSGCYAAAYPPAVYVRPARVHRLRPRYRAVYVAPPVVYVEPHRPLWR